MRSASLGKRCFIPIAWALQAAKQEDLKNPDTVGFRFWERLHLNCYSVQFEA